MHSGLDFRGDYGEPIYAVAAGRVAVAGTEGGYGNMVEIDHGAGLSTRYGHMSQIDVVEGQTIAVGQIIGRIGSTGRSTGNHLHYEVRVDGEPSIPAAFSRPAACCRRRNSALSDRKRRIMEPTSPRVNAAHNNCGSSAVNTAPIVRFPSPVNGQRKRDSAFPVNAEWSCATIPLSQLGGIVGRV